MEAKAISELMLRQEGQNGSPQKYEQTLTLTPAEQQVLSVKYKSKQIQFMDEAQGMTWAKIMLLKISVITGWVIPTDDSLFIITLDQFKKHLTEQYFELNPDEIEYAFRTRGTQVEDWGKNMNLNLIDKILRPYLHNRYYLSETEEKLKKGDDGWCERSSLNWYREQIEKSYQAFLAGDSPQPYWYWYEVLVQDKFIEKNFYKAELKRLQESEKDAGDVQNSRLAKCKAVIKLFRIGKQQCNSLYTATKEAV